MTDWHVYRASKLALVPGVRVRRRLPENHPKKSRTHPPPAAPKRRHMKAARKKPPTYRAHPHHGNKTFDDLRPWQQAAYLARDVGKENRCLTDWERRFCWSIAGQRRPPSEWQFKKLQQILEKIFEYID